MRSLFFLLLLSLFPAAMSAQPACVTNNCCCGTPIEVGVPNGDFEAPPYPPSTGRITFYTGENYSGWYVNGGSFDLLGPNYSNFTQGNPNGPSQFIDLNGFEPGTISTTLTGLMPGANYTIVLWYAINPGASVASCNILVAGGSWLNASWSATNPGGQQWLERCFTFTAQGTSAELRFIGSSNFTTAGMLLDDITLWKCPIDTEKPVVGNPPPSPLLVECSDPIPLPDDFQLSDNCSTQFDINLTEQTIPQTCFYNLQRTWIITDECGNTTTATQLVQVRDTQPPSFSFPPSDYAVSCTENYLSEFFNWLNSRGNGEAIDNCDPDVAWSFTYPKLPNGPCQSIPATFTATDDCGNKTTATAFFTVEDNDPPILLAEAVNDTVWCSNTASAVLTTWLVTKGGAQALDACGPVLWTNNFSGDSTATVIEVTFTATDICQNSVSTTAAFVQPVSNDTVFTMAETCDPALVGTLVQTLSNQYGCDSTVILVTNLKSMPVLSLSVSDYSGFGVSCSGNTDGSAGVIASGAAPFSFLWSNGAATPQLTALQAGIYTITVTDANGCTGTASVSLDEPAPLLLLPQVQNDCSGNGLGSILATASGGAAPYQFALDGLPFQSNGLFENLLPGTHVLSIRDANGCSQSETLTVAAPQLLQVELGPDRNIALGDAISLEVLLNIPTDSLASVLWLLPDSVSCTNCLSQTVVPLATGIYSVQVSSLNGCTATDALRVFVRKVRDIYVPSAFSPDNDGLNDRVYIFAKETAVRRVKHFMVFDRWGEALVRFSDFLPNDPDFGWDGTFRGQPMPSGVYVWYAEIEFADGETEVFTGDVLLVR